MAQGWFQEVGAGSSAREGGKALVKIHTDDNTPGAVIQTSSITTGVTLNKRTGAITTVSQTVAAAAEADFAVTNNQVKVGDIVLVCIGTHTSAGTFIASVSAVADGSFTIRLTNVHASAAGDDVLVINFVVIGAAFRRFEFVE